MKKLFLNTSFEKRYCENSYKTNYCCKTFCDSSAVTKKVCRTNIFLPSLDAGLVVCVNFLKTNMIFFHFLVEKLCFVENNYVKYKKTLPKSIGVEGGIIAKSPRVQINHRSIYIYRQ